MKDTRNVGTGLDNVYQSVPVGEESAKSDAMKLASHQVNKYSIFDVVGTWHIFGLLIIPFSLAFLVALIPNDLKYNTSIIPLLPSRDIVDESISSVLAGTGGLHSNVHVVRKQRDGYHELHTDINVLAYVKSYVQMPLVNISTNLCNSTSGEADSGLLSGTILLTSRLFDHRNISYQSIHYSAVLTNDTVSLSDFQLFNRNCSQILAHAAEPLTKDTHLMMPLMMQSFDAPHVLTADNHWMAFRSESNGISETLHTMPEYVLITHNSDYNELICICGLMMSVFTLICGVYVVAVVIIHAWHQNKDQLSALDHKSGDNDSNATNNSWASCCHRYWRCCALVIFGVTSEQYISILLLMSLFFWQNPFRCCYVLYHYWYAGFPSNTGLLISGLSSGMSYFGLQCFLALYISSLKYSKLSHVGSYHSTPSASNQHTPLAQSSGVNYGSRLAVPKSSYFSPTSARSPSDSAYYNSQFWLYSSSQQWTNRYRHEYDRIAEQETRKRLHEEEQRYMLLNYTVNKLLLLLGTWVLVWLYWTMKFPELSRRVFTISDNSTDDSLAYKVCYNVVEFALILLSLVWIKIVLNSLYVTAVKLKKSNYLSNRFHQTAYILIVAQINLGLLVFSVCLLWGISSMGITASGFQLYGRYEILDWLQYLVRWLDYAGGLHALVSAGPLSPPSMSLFMFVSSLVYSIVYITLPVRINLAGDNDDMSRYVGDNRSYYINLERYDHLRAYNVVHKMNVTQRRTTHQQLRKLLLEKEYHSFMKRYVACKSVTRRSNVFCLETACLLLEASYQAYFPAKRSPVLNVNGSGPQQLSRKNSERSPMSAGGAEKEDYKRISVGSSSNTPILAGAGISGPVLDLTKLGLELVDTFQEASVSTFGYLGVHYTSHSEDNFSNQPDRELSSAVVAFRGSTAANFVIDFKFALIPLPDLKHSRAYFVDIIRAYQKGDSGDVCVEDLTGTKSEAVSSSGSSRNAGVSQSKSHHDFSELLEAMESGLDGTVDEHSKKYFQLNSHIEVGTNEDAELTDKVRDSPPQTVLRKMKAMGSKIPLVKEGFPRVHAGFWQAYASIRDQVLASVVRVIAQHRQQYCSTQVQDELVSGSEVEVSAPDSNASAGIEMLSREHQHQTTKHVPVSELALDLSEIKPLQLCFTGHSLGGTMASLAALDIAINMSTILEALCYVDYFKPHVASSASSCQPDVFLRSGLSNLSYLRSWVTPELSVYTYGCPRIGNLAFMQLMKNTVETNYRVQLNGDLVPMVPKIPGYYYHSGVNVIVDEEEKGSLIVKPSLVEQWLLRSATGSLVNHSLDKYRDCLESCFEEAELKEYLSKTLTAAEEPQFQVEEGFVLESAGSAGVSSGGGRTSIGSSGALNGGNNRRVSAGKAVELPEWLISDR